MFYVSAFYILCINGFRLSSHLVNEYVMLCYVMLIIEPGQRLTHEKSTFRQRSHNDLWSQRLLNSDTLSHVGERQIFPMTLPTVVYCCCCQTRTVPAAGSAVWALWTSHSRSRLYSAHNSQSWHSAVCSAPTTTRRRQVHQRWPRSWQPRQCSVLQFIHLTLLESYQSDDFIS